MRTKEQEMPAYYMEQRHRIETANRLALSLVAELNQIAKHNLNADGGNVIAIDDAFKLAVNTREAVARIRHPERPNYP